MYSLQSFLVWTVVLSITTEGYSDSMKHPQQQEKHIPMTPTYQESSVPPYWENMLREFVFRTISPPPPGNNGLYKCLLNAPFYKGPFPIISKDRDVVVLSRGDVYYLPNNHWILCQVGCIECEVCAEQKNPTVKWILRRIKRLSSHGSSRYDLQLTIIPQIDGSYHMNNLWPRSYIYVTSPEEQAKHSSSKSSYQDDGNSFTNLEDSFGGQQQRSNNFWRLVERDSMSERHMVQQMNNDTTVRENVDNTKESNVTSVAPKKGEAEYNYRERNFRQRPRLKFSEKPIIEDSMITSNLTENRGVDRKPLIPKLILGTDQRGQKHLVHLVPAEYPPAIASFEDFDVSNSTSIVSAIDKGMRSRKVLEDDKRSTYRRILRRILDSLNTHRRSIEKFLEPSLNLNGKSGLKGTAGTTTEQFEEHLQEETRNRFAGMKRVNHFDRDYNERFQNPSFLQKQFALPFAQNKERRTAKDHLNVSGLVNNTNSVSRSLIEKYHEMIVGRTTYGKQSKRNVSDKDTHKSSVSEYQKENKYSNTDISKVSSNDEHKFDSYPYKTIVSTESTIKSSSGEVAKIDFYKHIKNLNEMLSLKSNNTK